MNSKNKHRIGILLLSVALFSTKSALSGTEKASITFLKSITVNATDNIHAGDIDSVDTVDKINRKNQNIHRIHRNKAKKWIPRDLVYVTPGGLEVASYDTYSLSLEEALDDKYVQSTFTFSGDADTLMTKYGLGWGTKNFNGDFMPYLFSNLYEDKAEPTLNFLWERKINVPMVGDSLYLNYSIKIPKNSSPKWAGELGTSSNSFKSSFTSTSPDIKPDAVYRWKRGRFQCMQSTLRRPPKSISWKLPSKYKLTSFAVSKESQKLFTCSFEKQIDAFDVKGTKLWTSSGQGPLLLVGNNLIAISSNYRDLQVIDSESGKVVGSIELPRYVPKSDNTIAAVKCKNSYYIFLQIPDQSRILCYKFKVSIAE